MSLAKPVAETVARHLVATGVLIDENPAEALAHALAARRLASRIAAVREAVGLAAYHAGEWQTAIAELRTYHRMTGVQNHIAVLADCERALGRPERAIDLFRGADRDALDPATAIELLIVAAGARGDLGQKDAAVAMLQVRELTGDATEPWAARLRYAYADALLAVDRREEAREWFSRASELDADGETDAAERLLELDGVVIEGDADEEDATDVDADSDDEDADEDDDSDDDEDDDDSDDDDEDDDSDDDDEDDDEDDEDEDADSDDDDEDDDSDDDDEDDDSDDDDEDDDEDDEDEDGTGPAGDEPVSRDDVVGRGGPDDPDLRARAGAEAPVGDDETGPVSR
ncbi:Replicase polyprotein 1ab [Micromonospora musae]|uniref:Replicase polyprotein 1ab n=1 Tax=Micromonospora musae TaxID=1894970 RepID=UPI003F4DAEE4